jgi:hypothetical protein
VHSKFKKFKCRYASKKGGVKGFWQMSRAFFQSRAGDNLAQDINDRFIFNEAGNGMTAPAL